MIFNRLFISSLVSLLLLSNLHANTFPRSETIDIAAFGDSITRGWPYHQNDANGIANNGGYVPGLQSMLNNAWTQVSGVTVYNWGHPGEFVFSEGRARISEVLNSNPDYVLVMEGTNDLPLGIGPGTVFDKLTNIVKDVSASGAIPVIGTLLPRFDKNSKRHIFAVSGGEKVAEKMVKRTRENANRRRGVSGRNAKKHALGIHQKSNNSNGNSNSCNTCNGNSNSNGSVKSNGNWSNSNTENSPNAKAKAKARAKTNAKANANFKNARAKATAKASVNSPVSTGWKWKYNKQIRPKKRPRRKAPNNVISNASAKQFEDMLAQFGDLATQ